jgi:hypothetical protein
LEGLNTGRTDPLRRTRSVPAPDPATTTRATATGATDRFPAFVDGAKGGPAEADPPTAEAVVAPVVGVGSDIEGEGVSLGDGDVW